MSENEALPNEELPVEEPVMEEVPEVESSETEVELAAAAAEKVEAPASVKNSKWPDRSDGVTVIAIYHFLISIPGLIGGCALLAFPIPAVLSGGGDTMGIIGALFGVLVGLLFTAGLSGLSIVTGIGLLKLKGWARWLAIAQAVFALILVPVGTIIGGLIIWYLLQDNIKQEFAR